jgi:hypothetical protein
MGRDRFAQQLLSWEWRGVQLEAAIPRCAYFCRAHGREVIAWCELRDISGGRRAAKAGKGRLLDYRPADAGNALADALRAFADVVGDEG